MSDDAARKSQTAPARTPSALDAIADAHVEQAARMDPFLATGIGVPGHESEVPDLSPAGYDARAALARHTLEQIAAVADADEVDAVTRAAMTERLGLELELDAAGVTRSTVNNIASDLQSQAIFDLMDAETAEDWTHIAERLSQFPELMAGWAQTLRAAAADGHVSARRQLELGAAQARGYADPEGGYFAQLVSRMGEDLAEEVRQQVRDGARSAAEAYRQVAEVLDSLREQAPEADAVGPEAYRLCSRAALGEEIDAAETYAWGIEEMRRIIAEQEQVAERINAH